MGSVDRINPAFRQIGPRGLFDVEDENPLRAPSPDLEQMDAIDEELNNELANIFRLPAMPLQENGLAPLRLIFPLPRALDDRAMADIMRGAVAAAPRPSIVYTSPTLIPFTFEMPRPIYTTPPFVNYHQVYVTQQVTDYAAEHKPGCAPEWLKDLGNGIFRVIEIALYGCRCVVYLPFLIGNDIKDRIVSVCEWVGNCFVRTFQWIGSWFCCD